VSKSRRLRSLVADQALYDRRAAGEPLRALAADYGVTHTTLSRHFRTAAAKHELREADRRLQAKRRARQAEQQYLEQQVQRRALEDEERDRELEAWPPPDMPLRSGYAGWLDERSGPRGLTSRQRYNANASTAAAVVASGGGIEQVIDATGLSREHVLRRMDAQIVRRALANDRRSPANARPDDQGLRRLVPGYELVKRHAAGETLRALAADYNVSHTTLSRFFKRPKVARQLRAQQRRRHRAPAKPRAKSPASRRG
jgi:uncharacterized protein (DUF433 family)